MDFGFLITARCNASCSHCTVNSGPHQTTSLSQDRIIDLMDQAAAVWRRERRRSERLSFGISGGEPFLDFERLCRIVAHGTGLGAEVSCVSNGYWATSDDRADRLLARLADAGLALLAVSTSRFHQRHIRRDRVERALRRAAHHGLGTSLKCALTHSDEGPQGLEAWARGLRVDRLEIFPTVPYLRDGEVLPDEDYIRPHGLPAGRCPAARITVREDGGTYTCCMPGGFTDFLKLGNSIDSPLDSIYDRFYLGSVQQVLRHRGPGFLARQIQREGKGSRLRERYAGICDLCAHIGADPVMKEIAERTAQSFADSEFRRALQHARRHPPKTASPPREEPLCQK